MWICRPIILGFCELIILYTFVNTILREKCDDSSGVRVRWSSSLEQRVHLHGIGHVTTVHAFGCAPVEQCRHPDQFQARFRAERIIRLSPPVRWSRDAQDEEKILWKRIGLMGTHARRSPTLTCTKCTSSSSNSRPACTTGSATKHILNHTHTIYQYRRLYMLTRHTIRTPADAMLILAAAEQHKDRQTIEFQAAHRFVKLLVSVGLVRINHGVAKLYKRSEECASHTTSSSTNVTPQINATLISSTLFARVSGYRGPDNGSCDYTIYI